MTDTQTVSIYQLADRLGVSATTVSRVLNDRKGIGAPTRERVWAAAREAGYRPKQSVRRMTIGLLLDHVCGDAMGTLVYRLATQVIAELAHHDLSLEVFSEGNLDTISQRYIDGVLAIAWEPDSIKALKQVQGVPIVIFNRPECEAFSQVSSNYRGGGRDVAQMMLDHGHRRVGFLSAVPDMPVLEMLEGFRGRLSEAGCALPTSSVAYTKFQSPVEPIKQLINEQVTAIWVCHPDLSYMVPHVCREEFGLDLPRDLSIVGLDDSSRHQYAYPPLTVATEGVSALVDRAMTLLLDQLQKRKCNPGKAAIPMEMVLRKSLVNINEAGE